MTQDREGSASDGHAKIFPEVARRPDPLQAAREAYMRRLPVLADELLSACRLAPNDSQALAQLRSLVHRLTGTAGSYGFPLISEAAEDVGQMLEVSAPWPSVWPKVEGLAERMREAGMDVADEA